MAFFIETNPFQLPDSCYGEPLWRRASVWTRKGRCSTFDLRMILSENRFPIFGACGKRSSGSFPPPRPGAKAWGTGLRADG
ncbi:hypothetical protein EOA16_07415 [Mesorhizobium sp. M7A.F.Ca.US.008.03.1.1]|nr:hypothetical protein EOA16_07415 [Mesorhizobium sp. M7A.F.Ca.US.008.03.1.1]